VSAAIVQVPPTTIDQRLATSGDGKDETVALVVGSPGDSKVDPTSQIAACTLAANQASVCLTALEFFATQSVLESIAPNAQPTLFAALGDALGVVSNSTTTTKAPDRPECQANGDVEREINQSAHSRIPIPDKEIALPAGLPGRVTVNFVVGDVKLCKNNLNPILNTPGGFVSGQLSLSAADSAGGVADHGPFVYSAAATAWTEVPGAPPGQVLTTMFSPAKFEASVNPQLTASFTGSGSPTIDVQIATATVSALTQNVTLVGAGLGPLLQVTLGPSLELAVKVGKGSADEAVKTEEAQGVDEATAVEDVADELASDAIVGIDLELSEYYGVIIATSAEQTVFVTIRESLVTAFESDPAITAFSAAAADAVPTVITPAEAASLDGEIAAADVIDVGALDELLFFFLL
jgi:hypothetical protein